MNILVCDDLQNDADHIAGLLNGSGFAAHTTVFTDAQDVLEHIRSGACIDVCFLDIVMPKVNGVELAERLRAEKFPGEIVFLTTSNDYAAESYQVKAFSYLVKPSSPESVEQVLHELEQVKQRDDLDGIAVKTMGAKRFVLFRDISHVEVIANNLYFRLTDGAELEMRATLTDVALKLLADKRFIQCHRSYIVNLNDVACVQGSKVFMMRNGMRVPISRNHPDAVKQFIAWVAGGRKR